MVVRLGLALFAVLAVRGQGTQPKSQPAGYPAHARAGAISIAAENMGHSLATAEGAILVNDYLVIEVALYSDQPFAISSGQFTLHRAGRKQVLLPQTPGIVAASLKYPDWEQRPTLVGGVGVGDGEITLGRPAPVGRFPDDRRAQSRIPGGIPRAPDPPDRSGADKPPPTSIEEVVSRSALPEGEVHPPVSGFLFFPYKGKLKAMRDLELRYEGPAGAVSLPLP